MIARLVVFGIVSASLTFSPMAPLVSAQESDSPQMSPVPDGSVRYQLYSESMDSTIKFSREMRATLDRTTFDLDALLSSLDYDAESIIEYVKKSIAFEQYPGVLRGPLGTLFSRAGNSIDQSLLLAKLLRDAGYDARIVAAELDTETAISVLQEMKREVLPPPPFADADAMLGVMERYNLIGLPLDDEAKASYTAYVQAPPKASDLIAFAPVAATTQFIQGQLDEAGVSIGSAKGAADLIEEARQYFWVQFKEASSDPWTDIHPVFFDPGPVSTPVPSMFFADDVPESLLHRFRFQVFIERKVGSKLEVLPVTAAWERPVANLVGVPMTFSNISDAMMSAEATGDDLSYLLEASSFFAPTFSHPAAGGERLFDLNGNLIDPMVAGTAATDLFATVNGAFGDAIGAIGNESSIPTLTAQWLELTVISPNGKERVFRRTTFDRIGAAARSRQELPADFKRTELSDLRTLMQLHTLMIGAGAVPRGFVLDSALVRFESARAGYDGMMSRHYGTNARVGRMSVIPESWENFLTLLSYLDLAKTTAETHRKYRSGPALYVHSIGLDKGEGYVEAIDIVSNPWRAIRRNDEIPRVDGSAVIEAGVWETAVEGILLSGVSGSESFDTWRAFTAAEKDGVEPVVLLPSTKNNDVAFSDDVRAAIDVDLNQGYAVVVPRVLGSIGEAGWWRVDIETGETVGRIRDGRGGQFAEKLTTLGIIFSGVLLRLSTLSCASDASSLQSLACCHYGNSLVTALTFAFGGLFKLTHWGTAGIGLYGGVAIDTYAYNLPIGDWCEDTFGSDSPPPAPGWSASPNAPYPSISAPP